MCAKSFPSPMFWDVMRQETLWPPMNSGIGNIDENLD